MITPTQKFWDVFKATNGALSCCEAIAIMNLSALAPSKTFLGLSSSLWLEMGTHKGKSAMAALLGALHGYEIRFILLDPEFSNKEWRDETVESIAKVCRPHGINAILKSLPEYSTDYLAKTSEMFSWVFSDAGSHQDGLPMAEVKLLQDKIVPGGIIAFHDYNSQFKEVKESYDYLVSTGKYAEVPIPWPEIIAYVKEHDLENGNKSWHHNELEFPCFVGALIKK